MNVLSKVLAKVAIRSIKKASTPDQLMEVANEVARWSTNGLITDYHLESIADAMEEVVPDDATAGETVDYSSMTKTQLLELAEQRGIEVSNSWTKAEIIAALEGSE